SRRRHTRSKRDWSSDVCSSDLAALKRSPGQLIVIDSQKPGTARIEESWILHSAKISGRQFTGGIEPDLVQHAGKIDQTFCLLIIRAWSLILHCAKTSRPVLKCQQSTCAGRTRPLYNVVDQMLSFLKMERGTQTSQSVRPAELHSAVRPKDHSNV